MSRKSSQKQAILRVLRGTRSHPDAGWIYDQVRKEIPNISLGTVYRNLKLLAQDGEILRLDTEAQGRFDGRTDNHYHFRCARCGLIFDIDMPVDVTLNDSAAKKTGCKVSEHRLDFRGLCRSCI